MTAREVHTDVLIVGGGCGGCAAALALLRSGIPCLLAEPTPMLGGQLSSQAVPPDENAWIEGAGPHAPKGFRACNATYTELRDRIRAHYRAQESLTERAAADPALNPGGGWVSRLCFAPALAHTIITRMLARADSSRGLLRVRHGWTPTGADTDADRITAVRFDTPDGPVHATASLVLEATETGDLLALASVEHAIGADARDEFGELHVPDRADPLDQQAFTWCLAVEHDPNGDHVIDPPADYDRWRAHVPDTDPPWTGPLFSWTVPSHNEDGRLHLPLVPAPDRPGADTLELWRYRRIVRASAHTDGRPDVSLMNVVQMDHWGAPLLGVDADAHATALRAGRDQALCFLHWMQTEAPRHDSDTRLGYPGLRLSGGAIGSRDGLALAPYIREPRRLRAITTLTERHVGLDQRRDEGAIGSDAPPCGIGEPFEDSIAIGHYPIDLHPSCSGRNSVYVPACPFRVPARSLVPRRVRNLIAAGKCLGVTHVANGSTRLHPVEWAIGEAAGAMAALALRSSVEPRAICEQPERTRTLQAELTEAGVPLRWPWEPAMEETR